MITLTQALIFGGFVAAFSSAVTYWRASKHFGCDCRVQTERPAESRQRLL